MPRDNMAQAVSMAELEPEIKKTYISTIEVELDNRQVKEIITTWFRIQANLSPTAKITIRGLDGVTLVLVRNQEEG